jgi:hypothetical protein
MKRCSELVMEALALDNPAQSLTAQEYENLYWDGLNHIRQGTLVGRAALCLLDVWHGGFRSEARYNPADYFDRPPYLFHGTHLDPASIGKELQPKTPLSLNDHKHYQQHGDSGVSFSSTTVFPTTRALFHHDNPAHEGWQDIAPFTMRRIQNNSGRSVIAVPLPVSPVETKEMQKVGYMHRTSP